MGKTDGDRWRLLSLAIGQGEIGTTPLQLANLAAIMANSRSFLHAALGKEIPDDNAAPAQKQHKTTRLSTPIHFEPVVEGMYLAVNSPAGSGATADWQPSPE